MDKGLVPDKIMQIHEMLNEKTIAMTASKQMESAILGREYLSGEGTAGIQSFLNDVPILGCEANGSD